MDKQMQSGMSVEMFLKQNMVRPEDNGFTSRVMERIPKRRVKIRWSHILQNACYALAAVLLFYVASSGLLNDILTAPSNTAGFMARIMKDGLYVTLLAGALGGVVIYNFKGSR